MAFSLPDLLEEYIPVSKVQNLVHENNMFSDAHHVEHLVFNKSVLSYGIWHYTNTKFFSLYAFHNRN